MWNEPEAVKVMREWWELLAKDDDTMQIPHAHYSKCGVRLFERLLPEADPAQVASMVSEDWQADAGAEDYMGFHHFAGSIFGLADLWCAGAVVLEQIAFLHCVVQSAKHEASSGGDALVHFLMIRAILGIPRLCAQLGGLSLALEMHNLGTPLTAYLDGYLGERRTHLSGSRISTEEVEKACQAAADSILALCKRADGLPQPAEEASRVVLQSAMLVTHHEVLGWWLCCEANPRCASPKHQPRTLTTLSPPPWP